MSKWITRQYQNTQTLTRELIAQWAQDHHDYDLMIHGDYAHVNRSGQMEGCSAGCMAIDYVVFKGLHHEILINEEPFPEWLTDAPEHMAGAMTIAQKMCKEVGYPPHFADLAEFIFDNEGHADIRPQMMPSEAHAHFWKQASEFDGYPLQDSLEYEHGWDDWVVYVLDAIGVEYDPE